MFVVPYSRVEDLGIFKDPTNETSVIKDYPIWIHPNFIKNGKPLTIEDDASILINAGTPLLGFKTADELKNTAFKCVGWNYINLKHIKAMYTAEAGWNQSIFVRDPSYIYGASMSLVGYIDPLWNIPLYLFRTDPNTNKIYFARSHKIGYGTNTVYPVWLCNDNRTPYFNYLKTYLAKITFPDTITVDDNYISNIGVFKIGEIEYIYSENYNQVIELPIDVNNIIIHAKKTDIPNYTDEEFNKTKDNIFYYSIVKNTAVDRYNVLFYWNKQSIPDVLKDKIIGVTPEKGFPIFDNLDLIQNGFFIDTFVPHTKVTADVLKEINGLKSTGTILDVPFAVLKFRGGLGYQTSNVSNLPHSSSGGYPTTHKNFFNFTEFQYKHPITGLYKNLYGFNGETRPLVLNAEIEAFTGSNTEDDSGQMTDIILKPTLVDGDYGLSVVILNDKNVNSPQNYETRRDAVDYKPISGSHETQYAIHRMTTKLVAKDATIGRTNKNLNYIYKDNMHLKTKNSINLDYFYTASPDKFIIFDRVPKNVIDNNNEWLEAKDTRYDFTCDGYRDVEALKWLNKTPIQFANNFDPTYQINKEVKELIPCTQLVDYKMKYISNQLQNCRVYIVDTKYFTAIGHSELYKSLLPFRCIFFPVDDMWLYAADNKIDKLNTKYFGENDEFVYDIQLFTKFCVKHYSKVFEVNWDTKRENNTDFIITEGTTIKYTQPNTAIDFYGTIFKPYTLGIINLYNLELNTEIK